MQQRIHHAEYVRTCSLWRNVHRLSLRRHCDVVFIGRGRSFWNASFVAPLNHSRELGSLQAVRLFRCRVTTDSKAAADHRRKVAAQRFPVRLGDLAAGVAGRKRLSNVADILLRDHNARMYKVRAVSVDHQLDQVTIRLRVQRHLQVILDNVLCRSDVLHIVANAIVVSFFERCHQSSVHESRFDTNEVRLAVFHAWLFRSKENLRSRCTKTVCHRFVKFVHEPEIANQFQQLILRQTKRLARDLRQRTRLV